MLLQRFVPLTLGALMLVGAVAAGSRLIFAQMPHGMLPTGKQIAPIGDAVDVGSFPVNMTTSPDGKYVLVTNSGFREQVSVIDMANKLVGSADFNGKEDGKKKSLYFGLSCHRGPDGVTHVAVSQGSQDKISLFTLGDDGSLTPESAIDLPQAENPLHLPRHIAGLAWSEDGSKLYAVANQSHAFNGFHGSVLTLDVASHKVLNEEPVGAFPLDIATTKMGVVVANEDGDGISILGQTKQIKTGQGPAYLAVDHAGKRLFVANSMSDTVSFVSQTEGRVERTVLLRLPNLRGIPGATPLGMAVSPDDKTLYVAMGDLNAIAIVDIDSGALKGYAPAGWYPTSLALSPGGHKLFVANAKGIHNQNPNSHDVHGLGTYGPNILEGTVTALDVPTMIADLPNLSRLVTRLSLSPSSPTEPKPTYPRIRHIVYIIKENRTYDQVFGDIAEGDGDPSLVMFGQDVTPNQHALAKRFALFDNFYVCAEVSADGWNWSTSGQANAYNERNVPYNYSGRGRNYDQEGTNNGSPVSLQGRRDVAEAAGGYLWDAFLNKGLSVRDYGMFNSDGDDTKGPDGKPIALDNRPTKPALLNRTCVDYRDFDMAFEDSDGWVKLGLSPFPKQMTTYGSHNDPSRFTTWKREFDAYVKNGDLPALSLLRLPRNHTAGTSSGMSSPRSMVADNDYAVGEIVDAISHSPFWSTTAIFIVEDDAQAGTDHIDCHRSPMLAISPYIKPGTVDSSFYNTDSVLATMEAIMGVPPHNQYLATARQLRVFGQTVANPAPYEAVLPSEAILSQVNTPLSYRAKDSERLLSRYHEETDADLVLNDILWGDIKGRSTPRPKTPGVIWGQSPLH